MSLKKKVAVPFIICAAASGLSVPAQATSVNTATTTSTTSAEIHSEGTARCWGLWKDDYRGYGRCQAHGTWKARVTAVYGWATRDRHSSWVRHTNAVSLSTEKYWFRKPRAVRGDTRPR